ncbi:multiprotein-bridging factor 1 family protein [Nostoc sp.]|uniref:helix-turn-helix domain-containing protein n=1 Tax=Nostoc sp. TaxID=1180 RepID=UPI00359330E8
MAQLIYEARTSSGLTQKQLAELVGTKQPVIARLEDADYEGHSLSMLQKIAHALNQRVVIQLGVFCTNPRKGGLRNLILNGALP